MAKLIYLDNSATTELSGVAKEAMLEAMEVYGNPSSLHVAGNAAHDLLEKSRKQLSTALGLRQPLKPGQLIFTSCGSEADQLALVGTAFAKPRRKGMKIISTDSEHPAVENNLKLLASLGFEIIRIPTRGGILDLDAYEKALNSRVIMVSIMAVNNETGAAYDLKTAFRMAKDLNPNIVTHTDAVQGFLKGRLSPTAINADLMSISSHKIHGPKGVGALYISADALRRRDLTPVLLGGGQEEGFRSGTENVIGIAGFCAAAEDGATHLTENLSKMELLRKTAIEKLSELPVVLNLPTGAVAPHILNVTVPGVKSETLLHELSNAGICISNGSACSSHSKHASASLLAFGLTEQQIASSVRISFSEMNELSDVDALVDALRVALGHLVRIK